MGNALSCAAALALARSAVRDGGRRRRERRRAAAAAGGGGARLRVDARAAPHTVFHQIGPGAVYFVAVTELGPPEVTTPIYSLGNTAKYAFECIVLQGG